MFEQLKNLVLKLLKVPPEPDDPMGDVGSLRVFRASYSYYKYQFFKWVLKSVFSFSASVFAAAFFFFMIVNLSKKYQYMSFSLLLFFAILAVTLTVLFSIAQIVFSYAVMRLDYEMRWYKVSDRSLRIREGIFSVKEVTMTFANIQNIYVLQGPLQRIFGISDLKVESAGGGSGVAVQPEKNSDLSTGHCAYFRGLENAQEIRDLITARIKRMLDTGLGNPEEEFADDSLYETQFEYFDLREEQQLLTAIRDELKEFNRITKTAC